MVCGCRRRHVSITILLIFSSIIIRNVFEIQPKKERDKLKTKTLNGSESDGNNSHNDKTMGGFLISKRNYCMEIINRDGHNISNVIFSETVMQNECYVEYHTKQPTQTVKIIFNFFSIFVIMYFLILCLRSLLP